MLKFDDVFQKPGNLWQNIPSVVEIRIWRKFARKHKTHCFRAILLILAVVRRDPATFNRLMVVINWNCVRIALDLVQCGGWWTTIIVECWTYAPTVKQIRYDVLQLDMQYFSTEIFFNPFPTIFPHYPPHSKFSIFCRIIFSFLKMRPINIPSNSSFSFMFLCLMTSLNNIP